jgi:hypothetical protein
MSTIILSLEDLDFADLSIMTHSTGRCILMNDVSYVALIGIDWADQKHDICLYDSETEANESRKASVWAKAFYQAQKQAGKSHQEAVRSLAFKWIRIIFRCWKDGVIDDESKDLEALRQKGSPLVEQIVSLS